jgi:hypothetical protein
MDRKRWSWDSPLVFFLHVALWWQLRWAGVGVVPRSFQIGSEPTAEECFKVRAGFSTLADRSEQQAWVFCAEKMR